MNKPTKEESMTNKNKAAQALAKLSHKRYRNMTPKAKKAQTANATLARMVKRAIKRGKEDERGES